MIGYIAKHWRGQFPLPHSYWLNGVAALLPFAVWFELAGRYLAEHSPLTAANFALLFVLPFLLLLPVTVWSSVGIWRSAGRRIVFGRTGWAWAARSVVLLNLAVLLAASTMLAGVTRVIFTAPVGQSAALYEVTLRGNTAVFRGEITEAAAGELELLLSDKSVRRLAIAGSNGGALESTLRLAKIIQTRKLFVVALAQCDAACTLLLAAGTVRAIVPQTVLGFRSEPGWQQADRLYRKAGLEGMFLDTVRRQPPGSLYEPSLRTLIASGFLTDIFVDSKRLYIRAALWCAKNRASCDRTGRQNVKAQQEHDGIGNGT